MKKYMIRAFLFALMILTCNLTFAQEETEEKKKDKPVAESFYSSTLIESQTIVGSAKNKLELVIHHRFGSVKNGFDDIFGIYAPSNIRMGLNYGITDKITIGLGTEKNSKFQELSGKYALLTQTRKNAIPVSVSLYGNVTYDARDEEVFGTNYEFMDRFSYFAQVIVARKFTDKLTIQLAPSYSHFNSVGNEYQNDKVAVMFGGRYTVWNMMSAIFEYHQPIAINPTHDYQNDIQAGGALGIEIATITHAFQVFVSNYSHISPQKNYVMNTNKFDGEGLLVGFNINVKFGQ